MNQWSKEARRERGAMYLAKWYILDEFLERKRGGPYTVPELVEMVRNGKADWEETEIAKANSKDENCYSFHDFLGPTPTARQRAYLRLLGYDGILYVSQEEASTLIEYYQEHGKRSETPFDELLEREEKNEVNFCLDAVIYVYELVTGKRKSDVILLGKKKLPKTKRPSIAIGGVKLMCQMAAGTAKGLFRVIGFGGKTAYRAGKKAAPVVGKAAVKGAKIAKENAPVVGAAIAKGASAAKDAAGAGVEYVKRISREYDGVAEYRTWTTADGKHQITARLVGLAPNGKVRLQKEDQKFAEIAPQQLCPADREYLETTIIDAESM